MSQQVIEQVGNYRFLKSHPLGAGATGQVYYGQDKHGKKVAVKSIDIKKITKGIEKQIENEIKNLTSLSSPFIVKLYDFFRSGESIFMVLEFCEDGDLKNYLKKKKDGLSEAEALTFMRHLMAGYKALLEKNIIHRDIKPANILLKQGAAKLSDFGFSRVVDDPTKTQRLTLLGTPLYTAPEILANHEFSNKCDVWSMGVVFYEMLHGVTPWTGTDIENLKTNIAKRELQFKPNLNPQLKQLLTRMLRVKTEERASWQMLLSSDLFAKRGEMNLGKEKKEMSFAEVKNVMTRYLKDYLVKSYLLLDMEAEVTFAPDDEPLTAETVQAAGEVEIEKQTNRLTLRRNFAFMHLYILALYYRNTNLIPKEVNVYMELEYALILRAYDLIHKIGSDFEVNNKVGSPSWLKYKQTPQYTELNALLSHDFKLLGLLKKSCRAEIEARAQNGQLPAQSKDFLGKFDKKFDKVFSQSMEHNGKMLSAGKKGVCMLMGDYLLEYCLHPDRIFQNENVDLAAFYENRERKYGLD